MADFGGFEHNRQTLRIVELLEHPYPGFMGLNLMYETRLGLAKHKSTYDNPQGEAFTENNCSLEGQIADLADRIAYNCHDLEDGQRARIIGADKLKDIKIFEEAQSSINAEKIADRTIRRTRTAKAIIDKLVGDCLDASKKMLAEAGAATVDEVCAASKNLIVLSPEREDELAELEKFLLHNFYLHESLMQAADEVRDWLQQLFEKLCLEPKLMPGYFQRFIPQQGLQLAVCDYIAGMTDRFASKTLEEIQPQGLRLPRDSTNRS
jgi:dGTPase